MKISILKEKSPYEHRVAASPDTVKKLKQLGFEIFIEKNAGDASNFSDEYYANAGAIISEDITKILSDADILLKVQAPDADELKLLPQKAIIIGLLSPYENQELVKQYASGNYTSFALELLPRITRAQTMDVLSSQSNLAGYRAVIEASSLYQGAFPMMMTAAGTISPVRALIIGAGVAGLQALATARRLGAVVSVFDVRIAAKEQVESLGGKFIEIPQEEEQNSTYAKEVSDDYKAKQQALILENIKKSDIVITTAMIPGKKAPELITKEMVESMKPGSVIVDIATSAGGNCVLSQKDQVITHNKVSIIGYSNLAARIAEDASLLYAKNLVSFIELIYDKEHKKINIDHDDEIIINTLLTQKGEIANQKIKEFYQNG